MKFEMKYTLKELDNLINLLDKNSNDNLYFDDLVNLYDTNNNSSVHIMSDSKDKSLSIIYKKNNKILKQELIDFKKMNTVGKLKRFLINKIKEYNSL